MGSHIIVLQFVGRIGADQFLFYRRKRSGMIGIHRGNLAPGKNIVMDAPQPFDPYLHFFRQSLIRDAHAGKLGFSSFPGDLIRMIDG